MVEVDGFVPLLLVVVDLDVEAGTVLCACVSEVDFDKLVDALSLTDPFGVLEVTWC